MEENNNQQQIAENLELQQEEVSASLNKVEKAAEVTDQDKVIAEKRNAKRKVMSEEQSINFLYDDLSSFLKEKIDIDNTYGGNFEKIPTGIDVLDAIAGGGFPVGNFSMIVGNPGTFKSALLASIISNGQKQYTNKFLAVYHDSESSMSSDRLAAMGVCNPEIRPYNDVTIESVFQSIHAIASFEELRKLTDYYALVAWDSIANTPCEKDKTTDDINQTVGLKARILSSMFARYLSRMREHKITLIAVNQLRESLAMGPFAGQSDIAHSGGQDIPGGKSVKFNAFHLLWLKNRGDLKAEQYGFPAIKLEAQFHKNKFFRPFVPVTLVADINHGVSNFWSNFMLLVEHKLLNTGIWNSLVTAPQFKFHYKDALDMYHKEPGFKKAFDDTAKETIQREIIEKYKVVKSKELDE